MKHQMQLLEKLALTALTDVTRSDSLHLIQLEITTIVVILNLVQFPRLNMISHFGQFVKIEVKYF